MQNPARDEQTHTDAQLCFDTNRAERRTLCHAGQCPVFSLPDGRTVYEPANLAALPRRWRPCGHGTLGPGHGENHTGGRDIDAVRGSISRTSRILRRAKFVRKAGRTGGIRSTVTSLAARGRGHRPPSWLHDGAGRFPDADLGCQTFADQAVIAVENVRPDSRSWKRVTSTSRVAEQQTATARSSA